MGELVSRNEMSKQLINGVGGVGAGIGLLIVNGFHPLVLLVGAGICGAVGLGMLASKSEKKAGAAMLGAGVLAGGAAALALLSFVGLGFLPWLAGIGLIGLGGFSIFKFFSNLKKRT
jgi:hypothetical protein